MVKGIIGPRPSSLLEPSLFILSLLLVLFTALPVIAEPKLIDDQFTSEQKMIFDEVQGNILSPYCPGRLLKDCPSTAARDLKYSIKEQILKGSTSEEILENLLGEYGEEVRAVPKVEGIGMLAWILPGVFLVFGLVVLLIWVTSQTKKSHQ